MRQSLSILSTDLTGISGKTWTGIQPVCRSGSFESAGLIFLSNAVVVEARQSFTTVRTTFSSISLLEELEKLHDRLLCLVTDHDEQDSSSMYSCTLRLKDFVMLRQCPKWFKILYLYLVRS